MSNSSELEFAFQIKRRLNTGSDTLASGTTERLRAARERALGVQRQPAATAQAAGMPVSFSFGWLAQLTPLAVLVVGLVGMNFWQQSQRAVEIADIDVQMLVDELPPNAYLDKGFRAWLGRPGQ